LVVPQPYNCLNHPTVVTRISTITYELSTHMCRTRVASKERIGASSNEDKFFKRVSAKQITSSASSTTLFQFPTESSFGG
jgi:hypothetical protein